MAEKFKPCSIGGCNDRAIRRGWCSRHYQRYRRHGDPTGGRTDEGAPMAWLAKALVEADAECIRWPFSVNDGGYGVIRYEGRTQIVSRVVCEIAHGPAPSKDHDAAHSCNDRLCGNKHHISWKTREGNMADAIAAGTWMHGEMAPHSKLTEHDVRHIRAMKGVEHRSVLAARFNVTPSCINAIQRRARWAWLA